MRLRVAPSWTVLVLVLPLATGCGEHPLPVGTTGLPEAAPPADDPSPTISPTSVFVSGADGSNARAVGEGRWPTWSPDGRRLAFHRVPAGRMSPLERAARGEIHVVGADGSGGTVVARGIEPAWSADGESIAFTSAEGIAVLALDGGEVTTLLRHDFLDEPYDVETGMGVGKPAWSPDGARIAFEHRGDGEILPAQIFVMGADGSDPRRATSDEGIQYAESDPAWSPDGDRLAFWSFGFGIASVSRPGKVSSTLYDAPGVVYGAKPAWSPDGSRIAFTVRPTDPPRGWNCAEVRCRIEVVEVGGATPSLLLDDGFHAVWSPDGDRLAFVRTHDEADTD